MAKYDKATAFAENMAITADGNQKIRIGRDNPGVSGWGIGQSPQVWVWAIVSESFNNLTSLELSLEYSDDDATYNEIMTTGAVARAQLVRGKTLFNRPFPASDDMVDARWLRGVWDVSGPAPSAGKITYVIKVDAGTQRRLARDVLTERLPTSVDHFPGSD